MLVAKKLTVFCQDPTRFGDEEETKYSYPAYKFTNGLVLIPMYDDVDLLVDAVENIDAFGNDILLSVEEEQETSVFKVEDIEEYLGQNVRAFGKDDVLLIKAKELIKQEKALKYAKAV